MKTLKLVSHWCRKEPFSLSSEGAAPFQVAIPGFVVLFSGTHVVTLFGRRLLKTKVSLSRLVHHLLEEGNLYEAAQMSLLCQQGSATRSPDSPTLRRSSQERSEVSTTFNFSPSTAADMQAVGFRCIYAGELETALPLFHALKHSQAISLIWAIRAEAQRRQALRRAIAERRQKLATDGVRLCSRSELQLLCRMYLFLFFNLEKAAAEARALLEERFGIPDFPNDPQLQK